MQTGSMQFQFVQLSHRSAREHIEAVPFSLTGRRYQIAQGLVRPQAEVHARLPALCSGVEPLNPFCWIHHVFICVTYWHGTLSCLGCGLAN